MKVKELIEALNQIEEKDKDREIVLEIYSDLHDTFYKGNLQSIQLINHKAELCSNVTMMTDYDDYLEQFDPPAQGEPYGGDFIRERKVTEGWIDTWAMNLIEPNIIGSDLANEDDISD